MSQMRKDAFTGRWVIMGDATTVQPSDFHFKKFVRETTFCPSCENNEASTPPEVFALRNTGSPPDGPGWSVRVAPNKNHGEEAGAHTISHSISHLRPRAGYWNTIEDDFHWHLEILPQIARITGFEWASSFFYNPVSPETAARHLSPVAEA
jgi:galactose-1-phosphate uridylyltransferase